MSTLLNRPYHAQLRRMKTPFEDPKTESLKSLLANPEKDSKEQIVRLITTLRKSLDDGR